MSVLTERDVFEIEREGSSLWWLFLITGIGWVLVSFMVLAFNPTTPATIGYLAGFVLLAAGVNEFVTIGFAGGWKWLHAVLGVLFVITGIMALMSPFQTFGILALLVGWYLLLKGTFDIVLSIVERDELSLWGLLLASGILELAVGSLGDWLPPTFGVVARPVDRHLARSSRHHRDRGRVQATRCAPAAA